MWNPRVLQPDAVRRHPVRLHTTRLTSGKRLPGMQSLIVEPESRPECAGEYNL